MPASKQIKFDTIVRQYKAMRQKHPDKHFEHCISRANLSDAIEVAAKAIDGKNKRHSHQRRIRQLNLDNFANKLKIKEVEIKNSKSFESLMEIIHKIECEGIGELTKYDTATRIGAYLNIFPDKVYLHSGTRIGAKKLYGRLGKKKYLSIAELPSALTNNNLSASELEDILCIFKDKF